MAACSGQTDSHLPTSIALQSATHHPAPKPQSDRTIIANGMTPDPYNGGQHTVRGDEYSDSEDEWYWRARHLGDTQDSAAPWAHALRYYQGARHHVTRCPNTSARAGVDQFSSEMSWCISAQLSNDWTNEVMVVSGLLQPRVAKCWLSQILHACVATVLTRSTMVCQRGSRSTISRQTSVIAPCTTPKTNKSKSLRTSSLFVRILRSSQCDSKSRPSVSSRSPSTSCE